MSTRTAVDKIQHDKTGFSLRMLRSVQDDSLGTEDLKWMIRKNKVGGTMIALYTAVAAPILYYGTANTLHEVDRLIISGGLALVGTYITKHFFNSAHALTNVRKVSEDLNKSEIQVILNNPIQYERWSFKRKFKQLLRIRNKTALRLTHDDLKLLKQMKITSRDKR